MNKNENVEHIDDFEKRCREFLIDYVPDFSKCFVAGGFFPRFYHNLPLNDVDVYCNSDEIRCDFLKDMLSCGFICKKDSPFFTKLLNPETNIGVDLISFHNPKSHYYVANNFDFSICQLIFENSRILNYRNIFDNIVNKKFEFMGQGKITKNLNNNILTRMVKYINLGFKIDNRNISYIYHYILNYKFPDVSKLTPEEKAELCY